MPSTSTLTSTEKQLVKTHAVPSPNDKILSVAIARIYHATPEWQFTGLFGALVFGWSKGAQGWLRLVDLAGTRGVIWEYQIKESTQYYQDRTFFHTFSGDDCMIGLPFTSESEASELFKKISMRSKYAKKYSTSSASTPAASSSKSKSKSGKGKGIDKSMIGAPTGFSHLAHMGFDTKSGGFTSENVDPTWERLLGQLEGMGVSKSQIAKNESFIRNYVEGSGGPPPLPTTRNPPAPPTSKRVPPPAPPSRSSVSSAPPKKVAPPPPPPPPVSRTPAPPPSRTSAPPSSPLPPPIASRTAIPARATPTPPAPPPIAPPRAGPPPPPPPPATSGRGPPPPPARADNTASSPPAPPPPRADTSSETPPPARLNLLAAIQGGGIGSLKKASTGPPTTSAPSAPRTSSATPDGISTPALVAGGAAAGAVVGGAVVASGGGGDLASALAAALSQRKGNMGDSDSDSDADEEDWE